ncbi:PF09413 family protein [Leptospira wolbachii serovar Codice str. CDC]|uniref:PF09413 family protein n=1 Tax=Leptospira wolbachii serovar Codice str. CDC TaxID=1218599 RepID=R9A8C8_9LEPT|nr:DUF2007 domain-containing protein [Leptospira wolbachii]EOQ98279.1 PF09413 family protein [Leptospira wolbachii serovar Codice str. CDC]
MKLVFTSIDYSKIKIIESALLANGIKPILKGEDLDVLNGIIPRNSNLLELYVEESEFEDALSIIDNGKIPGKVFIEDKIKIIPDEKYESIQALSEKKDNLALFKLLSFLLSISTFTFLILYLLEIDNFKKFYNATFNPNMNYYYSDRENCLYETLNDKIRNNSISTQCYDKSSGIRINAKFYNYDGKLVSEVFNPSLLDYDTVEITYDFYGKKIFEYTDTDKDGIYDELIKFNKDGLPDKKYKDKNGNFRFEENEIQK